MQPSKKEKQEMSTKTKKLKAINKKIDTIHSSLKRHGYTADNDGNLNYEIKAGLSTCQKVICENEVICHQRVKALQVELKTELDYRKLQTELGFPSAKTFPQAKLEVMEKKKMEIAVGQTWGNDKEEKLEIKDLGGGVTCQRLDRYGSGIEWCDLTVFVHRYHQIIDKPVLERGRAKEGERYFYVNSNGNIIHATDWYTEWDDTRHNIGNYFMSEADVESSCEKFILDSRWTFWFPGCHMEKPRTAPDSCQYFNTSTLHWILSSQHPMQWNGAMRRWPKTSYKGEVK